jgi:hypothetical protein
VCVRIHLHVHLPGVYADPDTHSNSYFNSHANGNSDCNSNRNCNPDTYAEDSSNSAASPYSAAASLASIDGKGNALLHSQIQTYEKTN